MDCIQLAAIDIINLEILSSGHCVVLISSHPLSLKLEVCGILIFSLVLLRRMYKDIFWPIGILYYIINYIIIK